MSEEKIPTHSEIEKIIKNYYEDSAYKVKSIDLYAHDYGSVQAKIKVTDIYQSPRLDEEYE